MFESIDLCGKSDVFCVFSMEEEFGESNILFLVNWQPKQQEMHQIHMEAFLQGRP